MSHGPILIPLDGTPASRAALPVAQALGELLGASLHVVHVSTGVPPALASLAEGLGLEGAALHAWSVGSRSGEPSREILAEARSRHARLVVMCTHTAAARPSALLGHTALDVLREAPCPVVLLSPALVTARWRPRRIVLAYDGGAAADAAVAPAAALARRADAELLVLQVGAASAALPTDAGSLSMPRYVDQPQHEWPNWAGELLERLACLCPEGLRARLFVRGGDPGREILRFAAEQSADLVVLAWKGDWGSAHARTLKAIVREARCPLLIVRGAGAGAD